MILPSPLWGKTKLRKYKTGFPSLVFEGRDEYLKGQAILGTFSLGRSGSSQHFCPSVC